MLTFTAFALHLLSSGFPYDHVRFFVNSETIVLTTRELKSSETHKTLVCLGLLLTSIFFSFLNVMIWIFFCRQSSINYDGWAEILVLRGCRCCDFGPALTFRTSFFFNKLQFAYFRNDGCLLVAQLAKSPKTHVTFAVNGLLAVLYGQTQINYMKGRVDTSVDRTNWISILPPLEKAIMNVTNFDHMTCPQKVERVELEKAVCWKFINELVVNWVWIIAEP